MCWLKLIGDFFELIWNTWVLEQTNSKRFDVLETQNNSAIRLHYFRRLFFVFRLVQGKGKDACESTFIRIENDAVFTRNDFNQTNPYLSVCEGLLHGEQFNT